MPQEKTECIFCNIPQERIIVENGICLPSIGKRLAANATSTLAVMERARYFIVRKWLLTTEPPYCSRTNGLISRYTNTRTVVAGTHKKANVKKAV